jgi:hypothetical protein
MDGYQISVLLSMDQHTSLYFKGFAMRDTTILPRTNEKPALYILNTDTEKGVGQHWCVAFYEKNQCEFFDSFGMPPQIYNLENVLRTRDTKQYKYNHIPVQAITSITCGHHCLYFAFHRCRGFSMKDILTRYDENNQSKNDAMVTKYITKYGSLYKPAANIMNRNM